MEHDRAVGLNRENWDQRTPVHLGSALYQSGIATLRGGGITLKPPTDTEIGEVAGKRVLHVQCHIGLDTLSLARLGADATGLDFSPPAVSAAAGLADELGIAARFVVGDAMDAPGALPGERFDVVFASFGVFCWIPDLSRWMASAAEMLVPGGLLYVADGHPVMDMFEDDAERPHGVDIRYSYFRREPLRFGPEQTYADDGSGKIFPETVEYLHTLGELVTCAGEAGLSVEFVHEFPGSYFCRHKTMVEGPAGEWDFEPPLRGRLPMVFSMQATKR